MTSFFKIKESRPVDFSVSGPDGPVAINSLTGTLFFLFHSLHAQRSKVPISTSYVN